MRNNYRSVLEILRARLEEGVYGKSTLMPAEEILAAEFGVSRPTIAKVYGSLIDEGLIARRRGVGTIVLESGVSSLTVIPAGPNANTATLYTKGDMTITGGRGTLINDATHTSVETTLWSRCICCRYGNLTIKGGTIIAHSGPCSRNAGAFYAGGRLFANEYGEEENGAITITGGLIKGMAKPQTVRATNTKLTIGPHSVVENAVEFSGSEEEFHGDCLSMADETRDVVVSFK